MACAPTKRSSPSRAKVSMVCLHPWASSIALLISSCRSGSRSWLGWPPGHSQDCRMTRILKRNTENAINKIEFKQFHIVAVNIFIHSDRKKFYRIIGLLGGNI